MISDVQMQQLRQAVSLILELPREGVGCVLIVVEELPEGDRQRMMTLGLTEFGTARTLHSAFESVLNQAPHVTMELVKSTPD